MAKHAWTIGEITITVEAPDAVEVYGVSAQIKPKDRAGFLAAAEAVGGIDVLHLPSEDAHFQQGAFAWPVREDGTRDTRASIDIREPPREPRSAKPHPFFAPLAERVERERIIAEGATTRSDSDSGGAGSEPSAENPGGAPPGVDRRPA